MSDQSTSLPAGLHATDISTCARVVVGPGCYRCDLPAVNGVRAWVVEIEAGAQWPHVDKHDEAGESVLVLSGELIEGEHRYGPGSYILFGPMSSHQPRSEHGVKLFGFNVISPQS